MTHVETERSARLRWPLHEELREPVDEAGVRRMWTVIDSRRRSVSVGRTNPRVGRYVAGWALAAAAVALLLIAVWRAPGSEQSGPLLTADGQTFVQLVAGPTSTARQRFADGSEIEAGPGTRVERLASTADEFSVLLRRGEMHVSVVPGGRRRWVVEAKLARVEVVGTRFTVSRQQGSVTVSIQEGVVLVRSALLAQGVRRLAAGEAMQVSEPNARAPSEEAAAVASAAPGQDPPSSAASAVGGTTRSHPTSAAELLKAADLARVSGDTTQAARLLERIVKQYPSDPRAAGAAFTLGVLRLQQGQPGRAVQALRQALSLGAPSSLQQDCYLRLVEAHLNGRQRTQAEAVAQEYRDRFPAGRHRRAIQAMLSEPDAR